MQYSDLSIRYNSETGEPYIHAGNQRYAGFFVRLAAYVVDIIIVGAVLLPLNLLLGLMPFLSVDVIFSISGGDIILYLLKAAYFVLFLKLRGATPGKMLFRISVIKSGGSLGWLDAIYRETIGRYLCSLVLSVGYLMVGFSRNKRGLHDYLCDTEVVYNI